MPLIGLGKVDRRFKIGKGKANLKMIGLGRGRRVKGKAVQRLGWAIEYTGNGFKNIAHRCEGWNL
jgi:hypothetical protein